MAIVDTFTSSNVSLGANLEYKNDIKALRKLYLGVCLTVENLSSLPNTYLLLGHSYLDLLFLGIQRLQNHNPNHKNVHIFLA